MADRKCGDDRVEFEFGPVEVALVVTLAAGGDELRSMSELGVLWCASVGVGVVACTGMTVCAGVCAIGSACMACVAPARSGMDGWAATEASEAVGIDSPTIGTGEAEPSEKLDRPDPDEAPTG